MKEILKHTLDSLKDTLFLEEEKLYRLENSNATDEEITQCEDSICKIEENIKKVEKKIFNETDHTEEIKEFFKSNYGSPKKDAYYAMVNGRLFQYQGRCVWEKKGCLINALTNYGDICNRPRAKGVDVKSIINSLIKEGFIEIKEIAI